MEIKNFNVIEDVDYKIANEKYDGFLTAFSGSVANEVKKVKVTSKLEEREHQFSDEVGHVANKLIIEIDFGEAVVQPHSHFEDDFCSAVVEVISDNVNGLYENQD